DRHGSALVDATPCHTAYRSAGGQRRHRRCANRHLSAQRPRWLADHWPHRGHPVRCNASWPCPARTGRQPALRRRQRAPRILLMSMIVLTPGLLSSVQARTRSGWRHLGVGGSGALDTFSFSVANLLVGNATDAAAIEITLGGPRLHF